MSQRSVETRFEVCAATKTQAHVTFPETSLLQIIIFMFSQIFLKKSREIGREFFHFGILRFYKILRIDQAQNNSDVLK